MSPFMDKFAIVSLGVLPKIHFLVLLNFIELVVNDDGEKWLRLSEQFYPKR
jgi:hypothetical protein